jgi:hypothetical protein
MEHLAGSLFVTKPSRLKLDELNWKYVQFSAAEKKLAGSLEQLCPQLAARGRLPPPSARLDTRIFVAASVTRAPPQLRRHAVETQGPVTATRHRSRQQSSGRATDQEL